MIKASRAGEMEPKYVEPVVFSITVSSSIGGRGFIEKASLIAELCVVGTAVESGLTPRTPESGRLGIAGWAQSGRVR